MYTYGAMVEIPKSKCVLFHGREKVIIRMTTKADSLEDATAYFKSKGKIKSQVSKYEE